MVKYGLGIKSKGKLELYQNYLSVKNTQYLKWAIKHMVGWERVIEIENIILNKYILLIRTLVLKIYIRNL